jgi:hypothetical protein
VVDNVLQPVNFLVQMVVLIGKYVEHFVRLEVQMGVREGVVR